MRRRSRDQTSSWSWSTIGWADEQGDEVRILQDPGSLDPEGGAEQGCAGLLSQTQEQGLRRQRVSGIRDAQADTLSQEEAEAESGSVGDPKGLDTMTEEKTPKFRVVRELTLPDCIMKCLTC